VLNIENSFFFKTKQAHFFSENLYCQYDEQIYVNHAAGVATYDIAIGQYDVLFNHSPPQHPYGRKVDFAAYFNKKQPLLPVNTSGCS